LTLNGVTLAAGASSANFISGLSAAQLRAGGVTFDTAGFNITVPQALVNSGGGGLTKTGAGKLTLTGANTYSGATMVSGGSLALSGAGAVSSSAGVIFQNDADLDLTGKADRTLVLSSGRFLKGNGRVIGNVSAAAGSTIEPGNGIGNLTILGNVGLGGALIMELDRGAAQACDRLVCAGGTATGGGALVVTNIGPSLAVGDVFRLFEVPVSGFAEIILPELPAGLGWTNGVATDGTIAVIARAATLLPVTLLEGNKMKITWDPAQTGWRLQSQTNALGIGMGQSWFDLPGSDATNEWLAPIDPGSGSVFFRLVYP
jgi:autotransporter-associated beta strand protein